MSLTTKSLVFIDSIQSAANQNTVSEILVNALDSFGFDSAAVLKLPGPHETIEDTMFINTRSSEFATIYYEQHFVARDPVINQFSGDKYAYSWSSAYKRVSDPDADDLRTLAKNYGMNEGIVIPISQLSGHGMVSAATSMESISKDLYHAVYILGMSGYMKLMSFLSSDLLLPVPLKPRQVECLQWVAMGKSDKQISEIMGIAPTTVRNYIEDAKDKLGVANRTAAAITAYRAGLIHL